MLVGKKTCGLSLLGTAFVFLFLPPSGYYQTVQLTWQKPQVITEHFVIPPPTPYPLNTTGVNPPSLTARGIIVFDPTSSVKIYDENPNLRLPPASTTKIMTAVVTLESFRLEEILAVPKLAIEGQDVNLIAGEKMTVENLLYALLVPSANDAAETLAANFPGGRETFIAKMNEKAQGLYLVNTHFVNPTGIDQEGQYTSVFDLTLLGKYAMGNSTFAKIVATPKTVIQSTDGKTTHNLENINQLLGKVDGLRGIKTGWTDKAGECLISYVERDGYKIIIVVLGSKDRFGETEKLVNWVFDNFRWVTPEVTS